LLESDLDIEKLYNSTAEYQKYRYMIRAPTPSLPIDAVLTPLRSALAQAGRAVLVAEPGAGKTTRVPLALLDETWLGDRTIVMLEPRRLAARAAARRMAETLGEEVGVTIGYRVRGESRVSRTTRVEVVTDGLFLRRLQRDPELRGVGAVIFDEFHERGLETDLSLALTLDSHGALRPDLRVLVMSATLDAARVADLLDDAPVVECEGRLFPIETIWLARPEPGERIDRAMMSAIRRVLAEQDGSILAFLPGVGEIRSVANALAADALPSGVRVVPLYGDLPLAEQDLAIRPPRPDERKIVLATSIAETSLTIEGIRVVIDSGLARSVAFDVNTEMSRLVTGPVSRAASDQRRGRAGRLAPGACYRLWSEADHRALLPFAPPEILQADLVPLALELSRWGVDDAASLRWPDPPPAPALARARATLLALQAIDSENRITDHGRAMAELGLHPRLSHMMILGRARGLGALACAIAALIGERDPLRARPGTARPADLTLRIDALRGDKPDLDIDRGALAQARKLAGDLRRQLDVADDWSAIAPEDVGILLAHGWPERIAQRRGGAGRYRLSGGRGAVLAAADPLAREELLAIGDLDGGAVEARIFLAAPLSLATIERDFADRITDETIMAWDAREEAVTAQRERRLGALVLSRARIDDAPREALQRAMLDGVRALGIEALPWSNAARALRQRIAFMRNLEPQGEWPDTGDGALLAAAETWLMPFLAGVTRRTQFAQLDLCEALHMLIDWHQRRRLDEEAPTHCVVPTGSRIAIDYTNPAEPALAVRIQEMFGAAQSPTIAGGRVRLTLRLLSPAQRPIQVTGDLAGFWRGSYAELRREMRGRYPKHPWPEDPAHAVPTRRAKPRGT
jgi:ATP-dependent helicase HrpB